MRQPFKDFGTRIKNENELVDALCSGWWVSALLIICNFHIPQNLIRPLDLEFIWAEGIHVERKSLLLKNFPIFANFIWQIRLRDPLNDREVLPLNYWKILWDLTQKKIQAINQSETLIR